MKCVICHGEQIEPKEVNEEFVDGHNIVLIPIKVHVCMTCGERYYDRPTMQSLEKIRENLTKNKIPLKSVGKVLAVA